MIEVRADEPDYARLKDPTSEVVNRHGTPIETLHRAELRGGAPLTINDDPQLDRNPNRFKQHGFFFTADNCIACHACEAACSEKNDNPAHLAFRSVGFVEGGSYPSYQRINISMACNHCDNPVCLKGCPTRAYTKFAEYGAVLQDPDICFGCGYCTWVCPYNAPQLDPVQGQVTKCNMCVDRLEVGLKPACVSACLGKALDFGVIENIPEGRNQARTEIPGFPRSDITHPNIRFQQIRTTPRDMHRVDGMPLKYHRDDASGRYQPRLEAKRGFKREWNLGKLLGSHESAHVAFTLSTQASIGALALIMGSRWFDWPLLPGAALGLAASLTLLLVLLMFGLFKLNMHLGKPHRFYRGFYNLTLSPVSREIAGVSLLAAGLGAASLLSWQQVVVAGLLPGVLLDVAAALGLLGAGIGGWYMIRLYLIPARPFWNHWHTGAAFIGTALALGGLVVAFLLMASGAWSVPAARWLGMVVSCGLAFEALGLFAHWHQLAKADSEGAASFYEQQTRYGYSYLTRNLLLALAIVLSVALAWSQSMSLLPWAVLGLIALSSAVIGRSLFYAVVIPTTMPGAFFWKNAAFVDHAREVGLADMPQVGVERERHHPFRVDELWATIRQTSLREAIAQTRRVFTG